MKVQSSQDQFSKKTKLPWIFKFIWNQRLMLYFPNPMKSSPSCEKLDVITAILPFQLLLKNITRPAMKPLNPTLEEATIKASMNLKSKVSPQKFLTNWETSRQPCLSKSSFTPFFTRLKTHTKK